VRSQRLNRQFWERMTQTQDEASYTIVQADQILHHQHRYAADLELVPYGQPAGAIIDILQRLGHLTWV
jgi:hypothetical protein